MTGEGDMREGEIGATLGTQNLHSPLALAIFHRYIAPTLCPIAIDRLATWADANAERW